MKQSEVIRLVLDILLNHRYILIFESQAKRKYETDYWLVTITSVATQPVSGEHQIEVLFNCSPPSSTDMHKLHPTIPSQFSFPHLHNCPMKSLCRISEIRYSSWSTKHIPIKIPRNITPIIIFHCPHCSHHATKSTKLHCGSKMDDLIRSTNHISLRSVTRREECQFGIWKL